MRCISRLKYCVVIFFLSALLLNGCGQEITFEQAYDTFETTKNYVGTKTGSTKKTGFFAEDLCVVDTENVLDEEISEELSEAAGVFNVNDLTVDYARNVQEKLYPASTTKILTAYVALKYGNLEDVATVSEAALDLEPGSSVCELSVGDQINLEQLLYGLMMCSGNDAANVIAELISGSPQEFAVLMNHEAKLMGAVQSNFVNAHGLHDENHYTTLYDLYLIFNQAVKNEKFAEVLKAHTYTANYVNSNNEPVVKEWKTTNQYLTGEKEVPENVTVIGGKTGTTNAAGACLVLYSEDANKNPYISVVLKADTREQLYVVMSELLGKTSK